MTDCCVVCLSLCACWEVCSLWCWTCSCVQNMNVKKRLKWNSMRANKVTWIKHIMTRASVEEAAALTCMFHVWRFRSSHHHVSSWFHWRLKSCFSSSHFWLVLTPSHTNKRTSSSSHRTLTSDPQLKHLSPSVARYLNWKETTSGASCDSRSRDEDLNSLFIIFIKFLLFFVVVCFRLVDRNTWLGSGKHVLGWRKSFHNVKHAFERITSIMLLFFWTFLPRDAQIWHHKNIVHQLKRCSSTGVTDLLTNRKSWCCGKTMNAWIHINCCKCQ